MELDVERVHLPWRGMHMGYTWGERMSRFREEEEISEAWRSKFHTDKAAFHVPMPTIANHKEDMARVKKSKSVVTRPYVTICNEKINVEIEYLPAPVIKFRKGEDLP